MHFGHELRAITMLFLNEITPLAIPLLSNTNVCAMHMKTFIKIRLFILKILTKMHFGHKSRAVTLLFLNEIIPLAIPYNSSAIPMSMQSLKKIGKKVLKLEHGNEAQSIFEIHQGPLLLFQNEISPLAIPYHSSPIPVSMQRLQKIGQKVVKLEHGNEALMDRRTDGHSKFGGYNIIPRHFFVWRDIIKGHIYVINRKKNSYTPSAINN